MAAHGCVPGGAQKDRETAAVGGAVNCGGKAVARDQFTPAEIDSKESQQISCFGSC